MNDKIYLKARGKINLAIDVLGKREDGYHEVKMLMQSITLHDRVIIEKNSKDIVISSNYKWVPTDERNTAYKAAKLILDYAGIKEGVRITLKKSLPVSAGLAGGSSDAAAVLKGINSLYSLGMNLCDLEKIGVEVGADVPYCLNGGTAIAEGIGEKITPIVSLKPLTLLLCKPDISVKTPWVYQNLKLNEINQRPDFDRIIDAITGENTRKLAENMVNVLETVTIKRYPVISSIKTRLLEEGALGSLMSGSGPTVFGIFDKRATAIKAMNNLKSIKKLRLYITETICEES